MPTQKGLTIQILSKLRIGAGANNGTALVHRAPQDGALSHPNRAVATGAARRIVMIADLARSDVHMPTQTCLVLMFKAPQHSKRRLAAAIGDHARTAAQHLFACAAEDLADWRGPTCLAPAQTEDLRIAEELECQASTSVEQGAGNLGERIQHVNATLRKAGYERQIFIGIDCPALDSNYLARADALLAQTDVVLGPADDGGVVLMGVRGLWPPLADLPWSTDALRDALAGACKLAQQRVSMLEAHADVDLVDDLQQLPVRLSDDMRPARRRLCDWIESGSFAC